MKISKNQLRLAQAIVWVIAIAGICYLVNKAGSGDDSSSSDVNTMVSKSSDKSATASAADFETVVLPANVADEVVHYKGYTAHFNKDWHIPNCVTYEITATEAAGKREREGNFERDERVEGCPNWWDYRDSGYDRGHMAPAGDMKWDKDAMTQTFYLTNICPQNKVLNAGVWNDIEVKVREWAKRDRSLIVITGPIVERNHETIGNECHIAVPTAFFKVILSPKTSPRKAIAFICPNRPCGGTLKSYSVSVDEVEERTGMDFFSTLPHDEEQRLEASCNLPQWLNR